MSRSLMPRVWIKCTALGPRLPVLMRQTSFQGFEARENLVVLAAQGIVLSLQRPRLLFGRANAG